MTPAQLKHARRKLGLSVAELAQALEHTKAPGKPPVDPRTVRRWEEGTKDIPVAVIGAVTQMLIENFK